MEGTLMKGILKNKSKVILLSLLLFASFAQTTKAMNRYHQVQPRNKALTLIKGTYSVAKGTCLASAWSVAFPFRKTQDAVSHFGKGASHYGEALMHLIDGIKESSHGVWNVGQLGLYFYALDILLKVAAPWLPINRLPFALQDILSKLGTVVQPGQFSSWINSLLSTRLFTSTPPVTN
jgi:hypothetical protein